MFFLPSMRAVAGVLLLASAGCDFSQHKAPPPPREYSLSSPYNGPRTLAVAPTTNLSGSRAFDPLAVADEVFAELQQVQGLNVLPVNKTLAAMQKTGIRVIDSADAAQRLADVLGADALVVPVITAYDPYRPPVIGMTMQLYGSKQARQASEPEARQVSGAALPGGPGAAPVAGSGQPLAQVSAIFNAQNQTVLVELRDFARGRTNYESALQDEQFLADMDAYTRFVAHAMVRRLMEVERARLAGR